MNCKQIVIGIIGVAAVGCASDSTIKIDGHSDDSSIWQGKVEHPEIKLKKIFGINEEMLADTNRFPVSSDRWHGIGLPESKEGFKTVRFSLTDSNGKFGIFNVKMMKVLPAGSDDRDLLREFKCAVDMVGKILGVNLECPALRDVDDWRRREFGIRRMMRLGTAFRIGLADGYAIKVEATDATYVKREGKLCLVADASVEVTVQNNYAEIIPGRRRQLKTNGNQVAVAREVAFGADLSRHLSEAMKDAASSRRGEGKRDRRIKNKARRAEPGDVEAMK